MGEVGSFQDLRTWQEAHALVLEIYRLTAGWPTEERYGLVSQIRRATSSIPSNIAEGMGRGSAKDLIRFLVNARGSSQEVVYQLLLSRDLGYLQPEIYSDVSARCNGLAAGLNAHMAKLNVYTTS